MPETDNTSLFDLWAKAGSALSATQAQMLNDFTQRTSSLFTLPFQAMSAGLDPGQASEKFQQFFETSRRLSEALAPKAGQAEVADGGGTDLLRKIFDPREWMSATGYMDENVRRIVEGPRLADLGHFERKFAALTSAWSEVRAHSARHSFHVLEAWSKAATEFAGKLNEVVSKGGAPASRAETVDVWVEIANRHMLEAQRSAPFLETQRKLLAASSDLKLAQQDLADTYSELLGTPTRAEIDDLSKSVAELKREIRADKRRRRRTPEAAQSTV